MPSQAGNPCTRTLPAARLASSCQRDSTSSATLVADFSPCPVNAVTIVSPGAAVPAYLRAPAITAPAILIS
jgi:hypothetical protein